MLERSAAFMRASLPPVAMLGVDSMDVDMFSAGRWGRIRLCSEVFGLLVILAWI